MKFRKQIKDSHSKRNLRGLKGFVKITQQKEPLLPKEKSQWQKREKKNQFQLVKIEADQDFQTLNREEKESF